MTNTETITFDSLCEEIPEELRPRNNGGLTGEIWGRDGVLIIPNFFPHTLLDAYRARYERDNGENAAYGYKSGTPYLEIQEMRDLCLYEPLAAVLESLIGEPMGLHLNLCNWVSTERTWHQDHYLNPDGVNCFYLAVWIPLDDIHPDSGAFQFVRGSHRWPVMSGEKVQAALNLQGYDPDWPRKAEKFVTRVFDEKIEEENAKVETWHGKKGDVLIWHSLLAHRGSKPNSPDLRRPALIAHYSGINHRKDMKKAELYENQLTNSKGYFFPF